MNPRIGLYLIASLANIGLNYKLRREKDYVKLTLMPLLFLVYLLRDTTQLGVFFALGFSWLGDIFLINDDRYFIPGLISFLLAHVSYLVTIFPLISVNNWLVLFGSAVALAIAQWKVVSMFDVSPSHRKLAVPIILYATILVMMGGGLMLLSLRGLKPPLLMIGGGLFLASDFILQWKLFVSNDGVKSAAVMLTYTLAQLFIILSI